MTQFKGFIVHHNRNFTRNIEIPQGINFCYKIIINMFIMINQQKSNFFLIVTWGFYSVLPFMPSHIWNIMIEINSISAWSSDATIGWLHMILEVTRIEENITETWLNKENIINNTERTPLLEHEKRATNVRLCESRKNARK